MSYEVYTTAWTPGASATATAAAARESSTNSRPPNPSQVPTTSSSSIPALPAQTKPPTDIHPTAHLDPAAYVLGTHPISLGASVLIHPRARLVSTHGPLLIDADTVICERCLVGGPAPTPAPEPSDPTSPSEEESDPLKTTIGHSVLLHPTSTVHAGARLHEACIIEPHATVLSNVTIGAHAKVCAGVTVDRDVADWEVVYGDGQSRRKRAPNQGYEEVRLRALAKDREATTVLLKLAAAKALLAKRKG